MLFRAGASAVRTPLVRLRDHLDQAAARKIDGGTVATFDPAAHAHLTAFQGFGIAGEQAEQASISVAQRGRKRLSPIAIEIQVDNATDERDPRDPAFDDL